MLGLHWTQKTARSGLAFLCLCLFISLLSFLLFNSLFPAYNFSHLRSLGWSLSIFPPPHLKELFQKLKYSAVTDNRCCFCQELGFFPFVSFPLFFLSARVLFVLLVSFPVWYPILPLFSLQNCSSLPFSLICISLLPLLMSCFSPGVS